MNYSDNVINILTAKSYKGIGNAWIVKNLKDGASVDTIFSLIRRDAKENCHITIKDFKSSREAIKNKILKLEGFVDGIVAIGDENFPQYRGNVKNCERPVLLFYRGDLELLNANNKNVAVIGLLNPDGNTEAIEQSVVLELIKNGATIVSGLALGCDSIAHRQALNSGGKTVAILPSPLNNILPAANIELANEIANNNGLLVTEYYENAGSKMELSSRYQERDRLQALFSDSIVLSASYAKNDQGNDSGSRLAMKYAQNYSIPRAVIYDHCADANNPKYDLSRQLIEEDSKITIINRSNMILSIEKILLHKPEIKLNQPNIFDYLGLLKNFRASL